MKRIHALTSGILSALLVSAGIQESMAQRRPNTQFAPYSEVGVGVGTSSYYGDLAGYRAAPKATFIMLRWNAGLHYTRHFTPRIAARAGFTWARIAGDDYTFNKGNGGGPVQYVRNLHFRNDLKEFALTGIYKFRPDGRNSNQRAKVSPYVFAGLALIAHSPEARTPVGYDDPNTPEADDSRVWVKLQPLGTEGQGQPNYPKPYSLVTLAIPVGFGVRYKYNDDFTIAAEVGYRYAFSDYLDDVGGPYAATGTLSGLSAAMADRRAEQFAARKNKDRDPKLSDLTLNDPNAFTTTTRGAKGILSDGYLLTQIQLIYTIPGKIKCPPIR
ncbi:DUF6089 family protein [Rudanella paleaurantiibacter]|uniref:DUF6089 family protein n=1 Tax=Rudanella paleaurantiibacter TaxID=2614655 RepID=UPI0016283173|nr:DUF6089 family protein [Rudanella paleaurantiibacter]